MFVLIVQEGESAEVCGSNQCVCLIELANCNKPPIQRHSVCLHLHALTWLPRMPHFGMHLFPPFLVVSLLRTHPPDRRSDCPVPSGFSMDVSVVVRVPCVHIVQYVVLFWVLLWGREGETEGF